MILVLCCLGDQKFHNLADIICEWPLSLLCAYFSDREHVSFLCHSYAEDSGKGKSECRFTLGQAYLNMGGTKGNNKIHYQLFTDDTNSTRLEEMLKEAGREARGKRATALFT